MRLRPDHVFYRPLPPPAAFAAGDAGRHSPGSSSQLARTVLQPGSVLLYDDQMAIATRVDAPAVLLAPAHMYERCYDAAQWYDACSARYAELHVSRPAPPQQPGLDAQTSAVRRQWHENTMARCLERAHGAPPCEPMSLITLGGGPSLRAAPRWQRLHVRDAAWLADGTRRPATDFCIRRERGLVNEMPDGCRMPGDESACGMDCGKDIRTLLTRESL
jgi:hypothetical protein